MYEATCEDDLRRQYETALLTAHAVAAGMGDEKSLQLLKDGARPPEAHGADVQQLARIMGKSVDEVEAMIAAGMRIPRISETHR